MFKKYIRTNITEMRPVSQYEYEEHTLNAIISVSEADLINGSPKQGDMIARNPKNHEDQWLVAAEYFKNNFKLIDPVETK